MGLSFLGGFAGGLSKSIEKERDRVDAKKIADDKLKIKTDKLKADQQKIQYELSMSTRAAFDEVNEKILDIKSGKTALTDEEAVDRTNALNRQKLDMYKTAMEYGITLEMKDPRGVIDITKEGIENLALKDINGKKYVDNTELFQAIDDSNGQLRLNGNEIENRVMEQNSMGKFIPKKDTNGEFIYESTGESLKEFGSVFKKEVSKNRATSLEQDKQSFQDVKDAEQVYKDNPTAENLEALNVAKDILVKRTRGTAEAGERSEKKDIKSAVNYGRDIAKNPSAYSYDDSYLHEMNFKFTDMYKNTKSIRDDEKTFNEELISFERNKGLFDVFDKAVNDGTYKSGIAEELQNIAVKYTSKEFTDMLKLDREEIKNRIGIQGQIGDGVATYLKGLSGTAASQAEFVRTLNNFVGKDMTQEDIKQDIFSNFIQKKARDLDVRAKNLSKRGLSHTGGEWLTRNIKKEDGKSSSKEVVDGVEYETREVNGVKQYKNPADGKWYQ